MKAKVVRDYKKLSTYIDAHKTLEHKVVCTIGSWDMLHIGHVRYLIQAKGYGDVLVVGTDSDAAIKLYKGEERPIIPEDERMEMLTYQDPVDYVTLIEDVDENGSWKYELIRTIKPHIFIAVEDSYPEEQIREMKKHCDNVIVLPRQATTSTSLTIEKAVKIRGSKMMDKLKEALDDIESMIG